MERVEAPFTPEQAARINEFQRAGYMHPFTCPDNHGGRGRDLVATEQGLHCPNCDYRQSWVHGFMADGSAVENYRRMFASVGLRRDSDGNPKGGYREH